MTIVKNVRAFQEIDFRSIAKYKNNFTEIQISRPMPQPRSQDSPLPFLKERARERERETGSRENLGTRLPTP